MQLSADLRSVKWTAALQQFPAELYAYTDSLEQIDLSDNQLSQLPEDLPRFTQLKRLFLTNNAFCHIPKVLADCPSLEMLSFKGNQLTEFAEGVLPEGLRWLILTDNQLEYLPQDLGRYRQLQKVALAANKLKALPDSMQQCQAIALMRLSLNQLEHLPDWLFRLPKLAWLSVGANPACFASPAEAENLAVHQVSRYQQLDLLGQGASGQIYRVADLEDGSEWALKQFKGEITTDGCPNEELWNAVRCAGHPNLIGLRAQVQLPAAKGLVMQLIPAGFTPLGLPPSFTSISRDCYAAGFTVSRAQRVQVLQQVASAMQHLHQRGVCHGDLYAHNMLLGPDHQLYLGDFGAATALDCLTEAQQRDFKALDIRAFGYLMQDLQLHCDGPLQAEDPLIQLEALSLSSDANNRPGFAEIAERLQAELK